jgi:hypothetical protein
MRGLFHRWPTTVGDAVDLSAIRARRAALRDAHRLLLRIEIALHEHAVNLALLVGPLHEWANAAPVGTVFHFDDELLSTTGDRHVIALIELRAAAARVIDVFETGA